MNLLRNPSFEGITRAGGYTHDTHTGEQHGNFVTPEGGWVGWWDEREGRWRPETKVIQRVPPFVGPPCRIHEGDWATLMFVSFHPWTGGYYQVVDGLEIGEQYSAGFYAHAWVANPDLPNFGDPGCAPMGCGPLYLLECQLPSPTGDPVNDAWWSALFQVGIQYLDIDQNPDPAWDVEWGVAAAIHNVYAAVPELVFIAETSRVAVFTRGALRYGMRNNDGYVDSAWLEKISAPLPPPRTYERAYYLLPPDVTEDEAVAVTRQHFRERMTIGFSADDVAVDSPALEKNTALVLRPQAWPASDEFPAGAAGLEAFWTKYHKLPDEIIYIDAEEPPPPNQILLAQRDPEWADIPLAYAGCGTTIGQQGCFITDLAMAQRFYGIDAEATPVTVDQALGPGGYSGCNVNWRGNGPHIERQLRISIKLGTELQVRRHLGDGGCVMAELLPHAVEHFVLVHVNSSGLLVALDPWENELRFFDMGEAQSWRILTHVEPPTPDPKGRIGLHLQQEVGDWRGLSAVTTPMKFLAGIQNITTVKQINGDSFPVWRQWVPNQGIYLENPNHDAGANAYLDTFRDSMEEVLEEIARTMPGLARPWFGVESLNETYAHGDPKVVTQSIPFDRAWIRALASYPEISPVVYCAAVGNIELPHEIPGSQVWQDLVVMGREGEAQHAAWGYHNYWIANPQQSLLVSHWDYLAGRWTLFDEYLTAHGVHVNWFFGESGACGGHFDGSYHFLPNDGWKAPTCYAGDWPRYEQDLLLCNSMIQEWNTTHGNRAFGGTIFTTGGGEKWKWFEIGEQDIARLIAVL